MYLLYRSRHFLSWLPALTFAGCLLLASQQAALKIQPHYDETTLELALVVPEPAPQSETPPPVAEPVLEPVMPLLEPIVAAKPVPKPPPKPKPLKQQAKSAPCSPHHAVWLASRRRNPPQLSPPRLRSTPKRSKTAICRRYAANWSKPSVIPAGVRPRSNVRRAMLRCGWK